MKSNDNIPADEMLLAEAIAAAKANGMGWATGIPFRDDEGCPIYYGDTLKLGDVTKGAAQCCALGALSLAGRISLAAAYFENGGGRPPERLLRVYDGNDRPEYDDWDSLPDDKGESLGWAFRCAMTQEDDELAAVAEGGGL